MPKGDNPNSRKNLEKAYGGRKGFDTESARRAQKKSTQKKKFLKTFSESAIDRLTEEKQRKMLDRLEVLVMSGYMPAWDLYLKLLKQHPDQTNGAEDRNVTIRIEGADEYGN